MRQFVTTVMLLTMLCLISVTTQVPLAPLVFKKDFRTPASTSSVKIKSQAELRQKLISQIQPLPGDPLPGIKPMEANKDCEHCGKKSFLDHVKDIVEPTQTFECPPNISAAKRLMALSYQNCDALNLYPFNNFIFGEDDRGIAGTEFAFSYPRGYEREFNCTANDRDRICRNVTRWGNDQCSNSMFDQEDPNCGIDQSHYYNSLEKKCNIPVKCQRVEADTSSGELRPALDENGNCKISQNECSTHFFMLSPETGRPQGTTQASADMCGTSPVREDKFPYMNESPNGVINPFNQLNKDELGNEFIGWSCSEFISTALSLSGLRVEKDLDVGRPAGNGFWGYNVNDGLNDKGTNPETGCFNTIKLHDPGETLKSGDLILFNGHSMMVDNAAEDYYGVDPLKSTAMSDCDQENLDYNKLKFTTIHSFDTPGGMGPARTRMADYQKMVFRGQTQNAENNIVASYENKLDATSDVNERSRIQVEREKALGLLERVRETRGLLDDDVLWNDYQEFINSNPIVDSTSIELSSSMMWPMLRKHLSSVCKVQFCNSNERLCDRTELANALAVLNSDDAVIKVTRHRGNVDREAAAAEGCIDPDPPTLAHPECHGQCEERINRCPVNPL